MPGDGGHTVVFQQVDEAAQLVFVSAVGDRPGELSGLLLAYIAEPRLI
jgi:hypothetical protein